MNELVSMRTEPLEIPFPVNESYDLFITIPDGMALVSPPANLNINNEFGSVAVSISVEGQILHIVRKINIQKTDVPVEKYDVFKAMMNSWNSKKNREVVLKKGN